MYTDTHVVVPGETLRTIVWSVDKKHDTRNVVNEIERIHWVR